MVTVRVSFSQTDFATLLFREAYTKHRARPNEHTTFRSPIIFRVQSGCATLGNGALLGMTSGGRLECSAALDVPDLVKLLDGIVAGAFDGGRSSFDCHPDSNGRRSISTVGYIIGTQHQNSVVDYGMSSPRAAVTWHQKTIFPLEKVCLVFHSCKAHRMRAVQPYRTSARESWCR